MLADKREDNHQQHMPGEFFVVAVYYCRLTVFVSTLDAPSKVNVNDGW